jgi:type I restriction enzyme S subunit
MTAFPKYPSYKDSGVAPLGKVPDHWEVLPLFSQVTVKSERNTTDRELLSVYLERGVIRFTDVDEKRTNATSEDLSAYQAVDPGDFVLNNQQAWRGSVGVSNLRGIVSPAYLVLKLNPNWNHAFANYLVRASAMVDQYLVCSKGVGTIQRNLYYPSLKRASILVPPRAEQDRIVAFLNEKTAQIDALIAKKQRQIELLDEQKAILINRAVTRGLNPQAELQDSGIPWIGPIPKHWKVMKLKYLISIQAGYAFASSAYSHNAQETRLLRGVNVNPGKITWNDVVYWPEKKMRGVEDFALAQDDMVMGMDRPWVSSGVRVARITKADLPCLLLQRVARIRATKIEPDFLERVLTGSGFKAYFEPILTGVSVPHISPDQIGGYTAAIPPASEQKTICAFINQAEALCTRVKAAEEAQIQTLQTLRSTLIAHAVTGKIKV